MLLIPQDICKKRYQRFGLIYIIRTLHICGWFYCISCSPPFHTASILVDSYKLNHLSIFSVLPLLFILILTFPFVFHHIHYVRRLSRQNPGEHRRRGAYVKLLTNILTSSLAHLCTSSTAWSILQLHEILPSIAQSVVPSPNQRFTMYLLPFVCISYRLKRALLMFEKGPTLSAIPVSMLIDYLRDRFCTRTPYRCKQRIFR